MEKEQGQSCESKISKWRGGSPTSRQISGLLFTTDHAILLHLVGESPVIEESLPAEQNKRNDHQHRERRGKNQDSHYSEFESSWLCGASTSSRKAIESATFSYTSNSLLKGICDSNRPTPTIRSPAAAIKIASPAKMRGTMYCHSTLLPLVCAILVLLVDRSMADWSGEKGEVSLRPRRQSPAEISNPQIDLNISVPYIFSARLYPYGGDHGDRQLASGFGVQALRLQTPLIYFDKQYDTIYIHRDGNIALEPGFERRFPSPSRLPLTLSSPLMAVFWSRAPTGRTVHFRETIEPNLLGLAQSEINIQYRYGADFQPKSLAIITWEDPQKGQTHPGNRGSSSLFQLTLVLGDNACFVHFVYSRLSPSSHAVAGFNGPRESESRGDGAHSAASSVAEYFSLPGSATAQAAELVEKSNIGIPGEWLFRVDEERIYLCGAGYQGLECVDACTPTQWYLDCARSCHCADGNACNTETGECPEGRCNRGWEGSPVCDQDIDECAPEKSATYQCPREQPDCVNTPGAYLCICFEYDNSTGLCKGNGARQGLSFASKNSAAATGIHPPQQPSGSIPVPVMPLVPVLSLTGKSSTPPPFTSAAAHGVTVPRQPKTWGAIGTTTPSAPLTNRATTTPHIEEAGTTAHLGTSFQFNSALVSSQPTAGVIGGMRGLSRSHTVGSPERSGFPSTSSQEAQQPFIVSTPEPRTIIPALNTHPFVSLQQTATPRSVGPELLLSTHKPKHPKDPLDPADECHRCHVHAQCVDGKCRCLAGWTGDGQHVCDDVNECAASTDACGPHADCLNTLGSYQCVCNVGFTATPTGCVDLDECAEGIARCRGVERNVSMCVNTIGGYECRCRAGFTGHPDSGRGCVDINECELAGHYCGEHANCINTPGAFLCECHEGYEKDAAATAAPSGTTSSTPQQQRCIDMDECQQKPCDPAATCTNLNGTFHCECIEGYVGDGITCHETVLYPMGRDAVQVDLKAKHEWPHNIRFSRSVVVFGRSYDSAFVSPNGILSFGGPPSANGSVEDLNSLRTTSIVPFHLAFNPSSSGSISIRQAHDFTQASSDILTRASLTIQQRFNQKDFRATSLYVITFEGMRERNIDKLNTFQVAIATQATTNATYVIFLYEKLNSAPRGLMGIAHPSSSSSLKTAAAAAPTTIPSELLVSNSNVGQRGKWVMRVDRTAGVDACPAGLTGAPLCTQECAPGMWGLGCTNRCHCADEVPCDRTSGFCASGRCTVGWTGDNCYEDFDECRHETHECSKHATCRNTPGSYDCRCGAGFTGDGFRCEAADECLARFSARCAVNAHCDVNNADYPECVCDEGYHGDGRRACHEDSHPTATRTKPPPAVPGRATTTQKTSPSAHSKEESQENAGGQPFFPNGNWLDGSGRGSNKGAGKEGNMNKSHTINTNLDRGQGGVKAKGGSDTSKKNQHGGGDDGLSTNDITLTRTEETSSSETTGMFMMLVPISIGIVWLLLSAIFTVLWCCRRQRRRSASSSDKYSPQMMGWSARNGGAGAEYQSSRNRESYFSQFTYT